MAQAVGGVVGAVVGFAVGGPTGAQWGWAIGAAVGNSFTTIRQPRIGDLAAATASEGGPRARVYGTFRPIGGQVVWAGRPREIRTRQRRGKGGPRVESSTIRRSYAVGICEGPITGVRRIWRNNELVYDVRPGSPIAAESTRWMQGRTLLLGGWDQLPHPTIEAEAGAANAPAMRGTALLVVTDEDLTDLRGAIPSYQFEVFRGRSILTSTPYPIEVVENLNVTGSITGGRMRTGIFGMLPEGINIAGSITGGELRTAFQATAMLPEGINITGSIAGGELRTPLKSTVMLPEGINITGSITGGELRTLLVVYGNYPPEGINITGSITGGTLS